MKSGDKAALTVSGLLVEVGGTVILDVPELTLAPGEALALIGPNGAGKTTLLTSVLGLQKYMIRGTIKRGDLEFPGTPPHIYRRGFAMVFQDSLLFNATVFDNVASGLKIRGAGHRETEKIVDEQLERFGIAELKRRRALSLSGGEAQRVSLARAMAISPEILLLDEPFASLDTSARESIIDDLEKALSDSDTAVILVTHDRTEALRLADNVLVLEHGRVLQKGETMDVLRRPAGEFVASFAGTETVVAGMVTRSGGGTVIVSANGLEVEAVGEARAGQKVALCIRPENIALALPGEQRTSARNVFSGRIERLLPMSHYHKAVIDCGFPLVAYVTQQSIEEMGLREGLGVQASFKATSVHMIKKEH